MNVEEIIPLLTEKALEYGPKLVGAILVLIIGSWIIKAVLGGVRKMMDKKEMDPSLKSFVVSLIGMILKILLFISVLTMIGIEMTSFIAILGAAGIAIGMALSGTLQNFAGGVMILIFKPFKVGDVIDAQGYVGGVKEIQIFNTILKTPDNKTIIIPNGGLSTGSMTNFSTEPKRRVDFVFGIGYGDSVDKAREVLMGLINADERILKEGSEAPVIVVGGLGDSSVDLTVRVWTEAVNYWGIYFDMNEKVYNAFNEAGLNIPYPQMDVHVHKD